MQPANASAKLRIVVTGSPEHISQQLTSAVCDGNEVIAVTEESQAACGTPVHPNISWFKADVADREAVQGIFRRIRRTGGADLVIHLAADADAVEEAPELHQRINDDGLRHVVEAARELEVKRLIVFTPEGKRTTEISSPEGNESSTAKVEASIRQTLAECAQGLPTASIGLSLRPRIILTGASGLIGRHLLDTLKEDYQIFALARSPQAASGVDLHANISWFQVDINDRTGLHRTFDEIARSGGADFVIHLAAYYDFSGDDHIEYRRTNIDGLRNLLDASRKVDLRRFVFASSVGASAFPAAGSVLTEASLADGIHPYAKSKRLGEEMLAEYEDDFPSVIVRLAAIYSDWCEYPPLFMTLQTWLSKSWMGRVLGGHGHFALPYLHIRDTGSFIKSVLGRDDDLAPGEVLLASMDGAVSTRDLHQMATRWYFGSPEKPVYLPRAVCGLGLRMRDVAGMIVGERPFERPWMAKYIDRRMAVDASRTRQRLGWCPRERLGPDRRLPFLIENMRSRPDEWERRNRAVLDKIRTTTNLRIHQLLERHEETIALKMKDLLSAPLGKTVAAKVGLRPEELQWNHQLALHQLMNSIRSRDMSIYTSFCADLAQRRFSQGLLEDEVTGVLEALKQTCLIVLLTDPEGRDLNHEIKDQLETTTMFGCDQVQETFEVLRAGAASG